MHTGSDIDLGPAIRAIPVAAPFAADRYQTCAGTEVPAKRPLVFRSEAGHDPDIALFPAAAEAPLPGPSTFGWLTRLTVEVLSGSIFVRHTSTDQTAHLFTERPLGPGTHAVDLFHGDPAGSAIRLARHKASGVTKVRAFGFQTFRLDDGYAPDALAPLPDAGLAMTPGWSRVYGEPGPAPAERARYFRFRRLTAPLRARWRDGLEVRLDPEEQIFQALYLSGTYEPCTAAVLRHLLRPGDTVVDVGANVGLLTLLAARWVTPQGRVISLEPSQREFERLEAHVRMNRLANVRAIRAAAGAEAGEAVLHVASAERSGLNTLEDSFMYAGTVEAYTETVPVLPLDEVVASAGVARVDVIKIDVEGGEHHVVAGARAILGRDRPALLIEIGAESARPGHPGRESIETLLGGLGYELAAIDGEAGTLRRVSDLTATAENFLAAPPGVVAALERVLAAPEERPAAVGYDRAAMAAAVPYVSIILTGRNDDFGGDFNDRFFRALEFNHRHLRDRGIPHEFVFCEWRPIAGKPWLAEVLADRYPDLVPHALVSYVADGAFHDAYSLNPRLQFQEFIAKNIGIRRCRGEYILTTNSDIYLSRGVLDVLERRALAPRVLYRAPRVDLKDDIDCEQLDWDVLEDRRNEDVVNEIRPPLYTNASGDFLLLDRASYTTLRGFNEVYRVAKVHMDSNFCLKAQSAGIALTPLDAPVYHVGRGTLNSQAHLYAKRPQDAPWGHMRWKGAVVYDNDQGWGLASAPMRTVRPGLHYLEFSWDAVPPLAALRRVVLPVQRVQAAPAGARAVPPAPAEPSTSDATPPAAPYPGCVVHRSVALDAASADPHVFDDGPATAINTARLDFLDSLDLPVDGKRVLDAGCGVGHHTPFYVSRGCRVVGVDGRAENIAVMRERYPAVEGIVGDVQQMDLEALGPFDIVHCFGLLYHTDSPVAALRALAGVCREYLILETIVCDAGEPLMLLADEQFVANQALDGLACRPSPSFVAMALDRLGFAHVYGTTAPPRHPDFLFEWKGTHESARDGHNLRCMFVASRVPVACAHLVPLVQPE